MNVFTRQNLPDRFHLSHNERVGAIYAYTDLPYVFHVDILIIKYLIYPAIFFVNRRIQEKMEIMALTMQNGICREFFMVLDRT